MNDSTKRFDKLETRIDGEVANLENRINKLWDVSMERITANEKLIREVNDKAAANYQKIIGLALAALGTLTLALIETVVHHG